MLKYSQFSQPESDDISKTLPIREMSLSFEILPQITKIFDKEIISYHNTIIQFNENIFVLGTQFHKISLIN